MFPQGTLLSLVWRTCCLLSLLLLGGGSQPGLGNQISNVSLRKTVPAERRSQLETRLRKITGWPDLRFESDGALHPNSTNISGGSKSARALLDKALRGNDVVVIEDASRRPNVVFARVLMVNGITAPVCLVQIDFVDFESLMGDEPALKAFDVGWAFLHELDHVVENSQDSTSVNQLGECEAHINRMRQECSLPLRADYFHTLLPRSSENEFISKFVRLSFVQKSGTASKQKRYWVIWDAAVVGGLERHGPTWSLTSPQGGSHDQ